MSIKLGLYKCKVCGNVVQTLISGEGELVCCGEEMEFLETQYEENELGEKHVPEIFTTHEGCETGTCSEVNYVSVRKHPMTNEHYIQFIEVINPDKSEIHLKFFKPNETAEYKVANFNDDFTAIELCNIHGLWKNKG